MNEWNAKQPAFAHCIQFNYVETADKEAWEDNSGRNLTVSILSVNPPYSPKATCNLNIIIPVLNCLVIFYIDSHDLLDYTRLFSLEHQVWDTCEPFITPPSRVHRRQQCLYIMTASLSQPTAEGRTVKTTTPLPLYRQTCFPGLSASCMCIPVAMRTIEYAYVQYLPARVILVSVTKHVEKQLGLATTTT